jgi:DNA repair exonuclease SbcCD ATPase subunit
MTESWNLDTATLAYDKECRMATAMEQLKEVGGQAAVEIMTEIKESSEKKIDAQVRSLGEKWDKLFNQRIVYALGVVIAVAVFSAVTSIYTATKEVNQSVISLQERILSSQELIQKSQDKLNASNTLLSQAADSLNSKTRDVAGALKDLEEAKGALRTTAAEMKHATEELQSLQAHLQATAKPKPAPQ